MENWVINKKNIILFILLFIVFVSINTRWLWTMIYPIKYQDEIQTYSKQYDVDPFLILSIIQVETRFHEVKVSKKGAIGLMQIMPDTAKWIVEKGDFPTEHIYNMDDPKVNIELGSWFLSKMYHQYHKNVVATVAAYNAGPGNVSKWLQEGIWDGSYEHLNRIPYGETRHYIQRVLYFYDRYQWIYEHTF